MQLFVFSSSSLLQTLQKYLCICCCCLLRATSRDGDFIIIIITIVIVLPYLDYHDPCNFVSQNHVGFSISFFFVGSALFLFFKSLLFPHSFCCLCRISFAKISSHGHLPVFLHTIRACCCI